MKKFLLLACCFALSACGFTLQGEKQLAQPLHHLYLQTPDTYGNLESYLSDSLKISKVKLVSSPADADTMLIVTSDNTYQELLSVSSTQQTRQYNLRVVVTFEITTPNGKVLLPTQSLSDIRTITVQSDQVLGSSNEAAQYYQQMRRGIASAIMNRLASTEVTNIINDEFSTSKRKRS